VKKWEKGVIGGYLAQSRVKGKFISIGKEMTAPKFGALSPPCPRFEDSHYFRHVACPCSLFESGHDYSTITIFQRGQSVS
jgi:hypothetical protein